MIQAQVLLPLAVLDQFGLLKLSKQNTTLAVTQYMKTVGLLRAGRVVCPLREAAEKARAATRAALPVAAALLEGDGRSTSLSMSSSDPGAGSAASDVTAGSGSEP